MSREVAIVVAAGAGRRLGGLAKALLLYGERTLLQRIADTARQGGVALGVCVCAPPFAHVVAPHAQALGFAVVRHHQATRDMGHSVALGAAAAMASWPGASGYWLWPSDHAWVTPATLIALRQFAKQAQVDVVVPAARSPHDGRVQGGHPIWLSAHACAAMTQAASAPQGARSVIAGLTHARLLCDDQGVLQDLDTWAQWRS